jgi:putative methyltransferase (TIGR04325 family)
MIWSYALPQPSVSRVRRVAWLTLQLAKLRPMRPLLRWARATRRGQRAAAWLLGFRRPFPCREAAASEASRFLGSAHQTHKNLHEHLGFAVSQRVSDYPIIFFLSRIEGRFEVFDLGGNVGNLFYCYRRYLPNIDRMTWTVFDLPRTIQVGARLARRRGLLDRLGFTDDLEEAKRADAFLASGSLHYFDQPLYEILAGLAHRPAHVFVNRTPLTDAPTTHTVQDAGFGLAACTLHNRGDLIEGMQSLGYVLVDQWSIHEMSLDIPLYPELSVGFYSGMYFRMP